MENLLNTTKLKLLYAKDKAVYNDSFESLTDWLITGDWHIMTVNTNEDKSSGLDGNIAINTIGSYLGGVMQKEIELKNYSEILFEYYIQNSNAEIGPSKILFYIDSILKKEIKGPAPWQRIKPIGLIPGKHMIKFEYVFEGEPGDRKAVIDNVLIYEAKKVNCLINEYKPAKPIRNLGSNKTLRGFTRYQEVAESDTEISFTATFNGLDFIEFMKKSDSIFYFVDEFGICYRGIFAENIEPNNIALNEVYTVELTMTADQKTGFGFC